MELVLEEGEILVRDENINFVYMKNELGKILGLKMPEVVEVGSQDLLKRIFDKVQLMDQSVRLKESKIKEFQEELAKRNKLVQQKEGELGRLKEVAQKAERGLRLDLEARTKEGKRL